MYVIGSRGGRVQSFVGNNWCEMHSWFIISCCRYECRFLIWILVILLRFVTVSLYQQPGRNELQCDMPTYGVILWKSGSRLRIKHNRIGHLVFKHLISQFSVRSRDEGSSSPYIRKQIVLWLRSWYSTVNVRYNNMVWNVASSISGPRLRLKDWIGMILMLNNYDSSRVNEGKIVTIRSFLQKLEFIVVVDAALQTKWRTLRTWRKSIPMSEPFLYA